MHSSAGCALHKGTTSKRALPTYQTADIYYNSFGADNSEGLHFNKISILHQFQTDGTFPHLHKGAVWFCDGPDTPSKITTVNLPRV